MPLLALISLGVILVAARISRGRSQTVALDGQLTHLRSPDPAEDGTVGLAEAAGTGVSGTGMGTPVPEPMTSDRTPMLPREPTVTEVPAKEEFSVSGRVIRLDDEADSSEIRVNYGVGHALSGALGVVDSAESGEWGPVQLEFTPQAEYWFRLEGDGVIPDTRWVTAESADQAVVLDLDARMGEELWFQIYGDDGELLDDSVVEVRWGTDDEFAVTEAHPRDDGYIWVRGCMPGEVKYEAGAPGYASVSGGPILVPDPTPAVIEIQLYRTGRIEGWCRLGDQPVEEFEVAYWPAALPGERDTIAFTGRADGSFEIPAARIGSTRLIALSARLAQGEPAEVTVRAGRTSQVRLALSQPLAGVGRVVDRSTGAGIENAELQLFSSSDGLVVQPWGDLVRSDSEGRFELPGLCRETQLFSVRAPGYGAIYDEATGVPNALAQIGDVYLSRSQDLEIRLVPAPGVDLAKLTISSGSGRRPKNFSSEGVVRYPNFAAGAHTFEIECGDRTYIRLPLALVAGEDWTFDVELFGERTLVVEVVMADGSDLPWTLEAKLSSVPRTSSTIERRGLFLDDGRLVFEHLPWDTCSLVIALDGHRRVYDGVLVSFRGSSRVELRKELGAESRRVRVVDAKGRPLPSMGIVFYGSSSQVAPIGITDAEGIVEVGGMPHDISRAFLYDRAEGVAIGLPVDLSGGDDEEVLLTYDATSQLQARLLDGDRPVRGVWAMIGAPDYSGVIARRKTSGSDGLVAWRRLNRADFILTTQHPDYWPTRSVVSSGSSSPHEIQVRQLGGIDLQVRDEIGQAVVGAAVTLRSAEFGESLGQWIADGRVPRVAGGLVTGSSGHFIAAGLPNGEYRASVNSERGRWEAVVRVLPGEPTSVPAIVR